MTAWHSNQLNQTIYFCKIRDNYETLPSKCFILPNVSYTYIKKAQLTLWNLGQQELNIQQINTKDSKLNTLFS